MLTTAKEANKAAVANEDGLIEAVIACLSKSNNAHVLYNSIILLKVLAAGGPSFVRGLVQADCLDVISKLLERTLDDGQQRIHFEVSRLLIMIARSSGKEESH